MLMRMRYEEDLRLEWMQRVEALGLDVMAWWFHFGQGEPGEVLCSECQEFLCDDCEGGCDPVECIKKDHPLFVSGSE